jgi:RNA polymerase sigma-70 factor (ECF subfamily)
MARSETSETTTAAVESLRRTLIARGVRDVPVASLRRLVDRAVADAREASGPIQVPRDRLIARIARTVESHEPPGEVVPKLRGADLALACACGAGDTRAIAALGERYHADLKRAFGRIRLPQLGFDDFLQVLREKLFAAASPKIAEYGGMGDLRAWLRVVATRTALDLARTTRRYEQPGADAAMLAVPAPGDDPGLAYLKRMYGKAMRAAVEEAAAALSPEERNVLREHYARGLTIDQIASIHGFHRATAARRVQRARDGLVRRTRAILGERLGMSDTDLDSVMRLVQSDLHMSVRRVLEP